MNYYKILNEEECHHGLQYQTGLNIDPLPFHPYGDCEPGGIYFASEDILFFFGYGPWIREVTLTEDTKYYCNPGTPVKWKADRIVLGERRLITPEIIHELVDEGARLPRDGTFAAWGIVHGYTKFAAGALNHGIKASIEMILHHAILSENITLVSDILRRNHVLEKECELTYLTREREFQNTLELCSPLCLEQLAYAAVIHHHLSVLRILLNLKKKFRTQAVYRLMEQVDIRLD